MKSSQPSCGNGRFCTVCQKIVYDFTDKSQKGYETMLRQNNGLMCGRFQKQQLKPSLSLAKAAALVALSFVVTDATAQTSDSIPVLHTTKFEEKDIVFGVICEPQPEFIGGSAAMFKFISEHFCYPDNARESGIEGTVYVGFVVETDGRITDVKVKRGLSPDVNAEAVFVVKSMSGLWKPGKQNGKPMRMNFTLPIRLHLE